MKLLQFSELSFFQEKKKHTSDAKLVDNFVSHTGIVMVIVTCIYDARFEVFTAMKIQVVVFWVVTLCSVVVVYQ
jgi:hypothetical protein